MTTRFFLLLEQLQKLDTRLSLARSPLEAARLRARRRKLRDRFARLIQRPAANPA